MRRLTRRLRRRSSALVQRPPAKMLHVLREGPAPLAPRADPVGERLRIAIVVPQFRRGSGGHQTIATIVRHLEQRHDIELWLQDDEDRHAAETQEETQRLFRAFFGPVRAPLRRRFEDFAGSDVVVATGWQTVPRVLSLPGAAARAYLVQDHEPEFYATSAERLWAEWSYRQGLHCICASAWLAELVRAHHGASASHFDLGVDAERYRPAGVPRRQDLVLVYGRAATPRRAVPLVLLAMEELVRRRPRVEVALFGDAEPARAPFAHRDLGVVLPDALAALYSSATMGVVVSLTNPSLVPTEMLACGLPVVDVRSASMLDSFGDDGPVALADPHPVRIADEVQRLLDDAPAREALRRKGAALAAERPWSRTARQVEEGLLTTVARAGTPSR